MIPDAPKNAMRIIRKKGPPKNVVPVTKPWMYSLPWKMQAVLLQGLRAPDTHFCKNVKIVCRWLRSVCYCNADKNHTFMCRKDELPIIEELDNELNYCSMHFATHFLYALEIVAYKHPLSETKHTAMTYYYGITHDLMHFRIEKEEDLDTRLSDVEEKVEEGPELEKCPVSNDPYTTL